jgi:hypothetical protein
MPRSKPVRNLLAFLFCLAVVFWCASDIRSAQHQPVFSVFQARAEGVPETGILVAEDGTVTFDNGASNVADISISRASGAGPFWQPIDPVKFRGIHTTRETLYVRFRTAAGVASETIAYYGVLEEGNIVKAPDNPDVYIIKYKGGKQYRRLILSPSVFSSYGHLKWSDLKIVPQDQLDRYLLSALVQVAGDPDIYILSPLGDTGERYVLDTGSFYDPDSVYEINATDRDSYVLIPSGPTAGGTDSVRPVVTSFFLPATAAGTEVPIYSFTATDDVGVMGYAVTESPDAPSLGEFSAPAPASYAFDSEGAQVLYGWALDRAGNISLPLQDSVVIGEIQRTCAGARTQVCAVEHGVGSQERICSEGAWSAWGKCEAVSCESGYELSGGNCVQEEVADEEDTDDTDDTEDETDTTAPVISAINASVGSASATITWTTDESSTSVMNYGLTTGYGTTSNSATQVTSHSISLSGLTAATTYHYRVSSTDAHSNASTSTDRTFTTGAAGAYVTGAMSTSAKVIFLHHSTGGNVWGGGVPAAIASYNTGHGKNYNVSEASYPVALGNNPQDYWNSWVGPNTAKEATLETLTQTYDVIVWKHCFPVSGIGPDTGNADVASGSQTMENYKLQYAALKTKMHQFPNKRFLVWTGAALTQNSTDEASATRARTFFTWVKNTWDEPGDNIFIWDFWQLETEGGIYLLSSYSSGGDSHPNGTFNARVAPLFAQRIVDVIEGKIP